jgi:hypothetical protein
MGIEMWFKDDIRNILLSVNLSSSAAARWADGDLADAYRLGYAQAIEVLAVAFGILPSTIRTHEERSSMPVQHERSLGYSADMGALVTK